MSDVKIISLSCKSCGANIKIPPGVESINCSYCGTALMVQRGDGYTSGKIVEQVSQSIDASSTQTQSTIRESTQITQLELKRIQVTQQISSLQMQLSTIQFEIRALQRQKPDKRIKKQLKELQNEEMSLLSQIRTLQTQITPGSTLGTNTSQHARLTNRTGKVPKIQPPNYAGKDWRVAFILCSLSGFLGLHRFYMGRTVSGVIYLLTFGLGLIGWFVDMIMLSTGALLDTYKLSLNNRKTYLGKCILVAGLTYFILFVTLLLTTNDPTSTIIGGLISGVIAYVLARIVFKKKYAGALPVLDATQN